MKADREEDNNSEGLSGTISKQMDSGKIKCLTNETDVSRTPNVKTGDNTIITICIYLHLSISMLLTMHRPVRGRGCELRGCQEKAERILHMYSVCLRTASVSSLHLPVQWDRALLF